MPQITSAVWDKLLHLLEYGGLATLFSRALLGEGMTRPAALITAVLLTSAYGASDEIHQSMVPQRQADLQDWLVDSLGASLGAGIGTLGARRRPNRA